MGGPAPAAAEAPLGVSELAACLEALGPYERCPVLAVAVSGGPDSMALALLAHEWATARAGRVLALIVDHGLRGESAAEAALTTARLAGIGIPSHILRWEGPKPTTGIQAAAREARYGLLGQACRKLGILHLLLAHHADDQAETVTLRAARGSGRYGLAGMPAVREIEGLRLLRPLLGTRKARLLATLRQRGIDWIDDPSNRDPRFARSRLRSGADHAIVPDLGEERVQADRDLAAFMADRARPHPLGFVRVDLAGLDRVPTLVIQRLLLTVSGRTLPPRRERLDRLRVSLSTGDGSATLAGCILRRSRDELLVMREPRAVTEELDLLPGRSCRWDGRFEISLAEDAEPGLLRRLGDDGCAALEPEGRRVARAVPAVVRLGLPSLWRGSQVAWHPFLPAPSGMSEVLRCGFLPPMGLADAAFVPANVVSNGDPLIYRHG